ncbi:haloacid dehalogenase type II [Halomonas sp. KAO]|uniref:haloacid dehalogenase type II n=1 Tax=unclassified Halomonas TaxID=2609666 RepID=UPI0018A10383|nr:MULTISPECIES: haloacid dehalogenase type II [unclassified Halomonas]MBF7053041.1 haloacid dehalogenase type II [Halomonas sp. KAO]MDT0500659.1 haloacid dehalogenase type II [Halomonas sp. PAR7]MDT0513150.1 haloacid dehalogenase type II [Halomonas sp. LES1]MDT0591439.1 haloacid dehalogenase type II [Halomonas sp. PAR8]
MAQVLAFDVYGTLIDTHGVATELEQRLGALGKAALAPEFSRRWREKQLEYSFRRGLMGGYVPFNQCTEEALVFTDRALQVGLSEADRDHLMQVYAQLPAFADVAGALRRLGEAGVTCVAFSNGTTQAVEGLLAQAGIRDHFEAVISVDEVKRFKPDPAVYAHLRHRLESEPGDTWLISSNPFDVIGARHAGLHAAWVRRSAEAPFDPWGIDPDLTVGDLETLAERLT